jgi:hypothetical protein
MPCEKVTQKGACKDQRENKRPRPEAAALPAWYLGYKIVELPALPAQPYARNT